MSYSLVSCFSFNLVKSVFTCRSYAVLEWVVLLCWGGITVYSQENDIFHLDIFSQIKTKTDFCFILTAFQSQTSLKFIKPHNAEVTILLKDHFAKLRGRFGRKKTNDCALFALSPGTLRGPGVVAVRCEWGGNVMRCKNCWTLILH